MSHISRHDRHDEMNRTDEALTFKKPYQIVNRPAVTEHDMHEQYLKDPPHNKESGPITNRHSWGLKEGARKADEAESQREEGMGSPGRGKALKETILEEMTTEGSVHPHNPAS